jgi:hypothetical protein
MAHIIAQPQKKKKPAAKNSAGCKGIPASQGINIKDGVPSAVIRMPGL